MRRRRRCAWPAGAFFRRRWLWRGRGRRPTGNAPLLTFHGEGPSRQLFPEAADVALGVDDGGDCTDAGHGHLRERHRRAEGRRLLDGCVNARHVDVIHPGLRRVLALDHGAVDARAVRASVAEPVFRPGEGSLLKPPAEQAAVEPGRRLRLIGGNLKVDDAVVGYGVLPQRAKGSLHH